MWSLRLRLVDGIVDSCARIVEVDGRFEIELAESEIAIVRELQQLN